MSDFNLAESFWELGRTRLSSIESQPKKVVVVVVVIAVVVVFVVIIIYGKKNQVSKWNIAFAARVVVVVHIVVVSMVVVDHTNLPLKFG